MILALAALPLGCTDRTAPTARRAAAVVTADAAVPSREGRVQATSALRCEECHAHIAADWKLSAHAHAADDSLYKTLREQSADSGRCAACHEPLRARTEPGDPAGAESVSCDACHLLDRVDVAGGAPPRPHWSTIGVVKLGPLCDAEDHYFHKMGCSPLHGESTFCAACHEWSERAGGVTLPLITDFSDWQESPQGKSGLECQGCHMPSVRDEVARGDEKHLKVHDHRFAWAPLADKTVTLTLERNGDAIVVHLRNSGAGHRIPAGMPEHRIAVRFRALSADGLPLAEEERSYGRVLVDGAGKVVPFVRATRVAEDTRLMPETERIERFNLPKGAQSVEVTALRLELARELVASLHQPSAGESTLATQRLRVAAGARR